MSLSSPAPVRQFHNSASLIGAPAALVGVRRYQAADIRNIRFLQKPAMHKEGSFHSLYSTKKDVQESGKK